MKSTYTLLEEEYARLANGKEGFLLFCREYARIEDKESHRMVPFILNQAQLQIVDKLFRGEWPVVLKARQIGITTLFVVYSLWLVTFNRNRSVVVLNQDKDYANGFLEKVRSCYDLLPPSFQLAITTDQRSRLGFNKGGHNSSIRSVACTKKAARSLTGDLVIFDEHAYHKYGKEARAAAQPAVERSKGIVASISTSDGPQGDFYDVFNNAYAGLNQYSACFFSWKEWPGRTQEWYDETKRLNSHDPLYMAREYPETWEEAFQAATGRVYPLFRNTKSFVYSRPLNPEWRKYRAIDWGAVDAFVCLWAVEIPGERPGLSVDPSCKNTIREMLAYIRDEDGKPKDENNHAPDALRYMVVSNGKDGIRGHLHIYREMYIPNSAAKGLSLVDLASRIKFQSGGEVYYNSVADRSRLDSIVLFKQMQLDFKPHRKLKSQGSKTEIEQGIDRVNALINSTLDSQPLPNVRYAPIVQSAPLQMNEKVLLRGSPFA